MVKICLISVKTLSKKWSKMIGIYQKWSEMLINGKNMVKKLWPQGLWTNEFSLVEKNGREKIIGDAYFDHALNLNRPDLAFVYFDFHDFCRGMKFENVNILLQSLEEEYIKSMQYCWLDRHGVVCQQKGVFRVNCIDCLDRTNVVQTAIAKSVLETQLVKLGLIPPEQGTF